MTQTIKIVMPKSSPKKHHKHKHLVKAIPKDNLKAELKSEITTLEERRKTTPKGVRGFIQKLAINKQINERRRYLQTDRKTALVKKQVEFAKSRVELEHEKAKLKELNEKRQVNFEGLGGINPVRKNLKIEDLY